MAQRAEWPATRRQLAELCRDLETLITELDLGLPSPAHPRRRRLPWWRLLTVVVGAGLVIAGVAVVAVPLLGLWQRSRADQSALAQWRHGGFQALVGPAPSAGPAPVGCGVGAAPADLYALVTFPSLSQWGYRAVAADGTWEALRTRSMVHYHDSPAPGQQGNVIVAFHREPEFEHIDQLRAGDEVDVEDRGCTVYHYRVTQVWTLAPERVTQLGPTAGHDLTLVTCTPWFRDDQRLVWRATLVGVTAPSRPSSPISPASGAAAPSPHM